MADKRPNRYGGAQERPKVRPGGEPIAPVVETPAVEPIIPPVVEEAPVSAPAQEPSGNPLADMIEKKSAGKTYSIHLSPSAIQKLDKTAKQLKCSRSKALDLLIQKYL